jgi:hypothetical protein
LESCPALAFYENGQPIFEHIGFISTKDFRSKLKKYFGNLIPFISGRLNKRGFPNETRGAGKLIPFKTKKPIRRKRVRNEIAKRK